MKNKRLKTLSLAVLFLLLATPVSATLGERLDASKDKIEARQEQRTENREERQENRQDRRSDVAGKHADRLEQRFNNYYTRLNTIIGKIQARIDASTTKDTSEAQSKLNEAKAKLTEAKTLGESAIVQFRAIDPAKWSEQKAKAVGARDTANKAREAFKATIALLVEAVKALKSAPLK